MIQYRFPTGAAVVALLLAASRVAGAQDTPAFSVRDSAGVRIAESNRPAWRQGEGWTVGDTSAVNIEMGRRGAGTFRLPDGRIAVPSRGRLLFYRPDGTHPDSVLLSQEDEWIAWMGVGAGDSLQAFSRHNRIYVFTPDGRIARRSQAPGVYNHQPDAVGRFPDGTLLVHDGFQVHPGPVPVRGVVQYRFLAPDGTPAGDFAQLPGEATVGYHPVPFAWHFLVATRGDDVLVGDNRTFEYMVFGRDGALRGMVRRPFVPMAVTPQDVEAYVAMGDLRLAGPSSPALRRANAQRRAERRRITPPETFPAYEWLLPDDDGNVWALESHRPEDPRRYWSVFDPEGRWLGTVRLPDRFWPQQVGPEWILGTQQDAEGNTTIRLFPLRRTTGGSIVGEQPAAP